MTHSADSSPDPIYRVPAPLTFRDGHMIFEQLVTDDFERAVMIPARDLHIQHGRGLAKSHGYRFAGEGKVERLPAGRDCWLYRLTVPVEADS